MSAPNYDPNTEWDLSGLVYDISGDMASVRFMQHGTMRCRIVVRADGSLAIDASGIPQPKPQIEARPIPAAYDADAEEMTADDELPAPRKELEG
jgi:hypothetical protein